MFQPVSNLHILLVDDEPSRLELAKIGIKNIDTSVTFETATSAAEALELIHNQPFDCIVSDYLMPSMNGLEFCEKFRMERYGTPFVLFTCQDDEKVIRKAFKVGVDVYLQKRPSLEVYGVLVQHVRNLVSAYRAEE